MKIGLVNYEGDCLYAKRDNNSIIVYDQWNNICDIYNSIEDFLGWIDGRTELFDSMGKQWVYADEHRDAKPKTYDLFEFLK